MNKKDFRKKLIVERDTLSISERIETDRKIFSRLIEDSSFISAELILVYVSIGSEINTKDIIKYCFECGKRVAVPYCKNKKMDFYFINSFDDLTCVQFGIPIVDADNAEAVTDFSDALCIVPALSADESGYRLGYGGGYYDRFLSENIVSAVCLCRDKFYCSKLPHDKYDIRIKRIITESKTVEN